MIAELTGSPADHGWLPHKPETWTARFASTKELIEMSIYQGRWEDGHPVMKTCKLPIGTRVKIVMVSRFGDVGITDDLAAKSGYGARVQLDSLCDFSMEP